MFIGYHYAPLPLNLRSRDIYNLEHLLVFIGKIKVGWAWLRTNIEAMPTAGFAELRDFREIL
jgi:hypothetical protein